MHCESFRHWLSVWQALQRSFLRDFFLPPRALILRDEGDCFQVLQMYFYTGTQTKVMHAFDFFFFLPHLKFLICPVQSFLLLFIPWKIPKVTKLGEKRKNLSNECMLCQLLHGNLWQTQCLTVGVFASQMPTALSHLRSDWNCASLNLIKRLRDAGFGQE